MTDDNKMIVWTDQLSCGITIIDEQHKELVDLINEMFSSIATDNIQRHDYLNIVAKKIIRSTKNHFATEEKIMIVTKFPEYAEHKEEHYNFECVVTESILDYQTGKRLSPSYFIRFFADWVLSHITLMDKKFFDFLKKSPLVKLA